MDEASKSLELLRRRASKDRDILAIILFGSCLRGEGYSDIDVCLVLRPGPNEELRLSKKRLEYLTLMGERFDIQIFQQLPIYIRIRVLGEGTVELCKEESALYEIAFQTIKEFEQFEPIYLNYLEAVANAG